jgi:hypothetical protein
MIPDSIGLEPLKPISGNEVKTAQGFMLMSMGRSQEMLEHTRLNVAVIKQYLHEDDNIITAVP